MRYIALLALLGLYLSPTFPAPSTLAPKSKKALILGANGQDGSYMIDLLLNKGYIVHGSLRPSSNRSFIDSLYISNPRAKTNLFIHYGHLSDQSYFKNLVENIQPDEVYNLAAQSNISKSFNDPLSTTQVNGLNVINILEVLRNKPIRFCQASTAEIFGTPSQAFQNEKSPCCPSSPYGISKLLAHQMTQLYRQSYGLFACNAILFNHESPRRSEEFVTRKISKAVAHRSKGNKGILTLGSLDACRDWGYAGDYVEAMWLMLQQPEPDDYVIATGKAHSVRDFVELAFQEIGIKILWQGKDLSEVGMDSATKDILVAIDPKLLRPYDPPVLRGDTSKARKKLKWEPRFTFKQLVALMVNADRVSQ